MSLRFPSNITQLGSWVSFTPTLPSTAFSINELDQAEFLRTLTEGAENEINRSRSFAGQTISLPLPNEFVDTHTANWEVADFTYEETSLQAFRALQDGDSVTAAASGATAGIIRSSLRDSSVVRFGTASSRIAINPRRLAVFNATEPKQFTFSYTMTPKNEAESRAIAAIIEMFEQATLPERTRTGAFLLYPHQFNIEFLGKVGEWMPIIRNNCACTSISVNYSESGTLRSLKSGAPLQVGLSLNFMETEIPVVNNYGRRRSQIINGGGTNVSALESFPASVAGDLGPTIGDTLRDFGEGNEFLEDIEDQLGSNPSFPNLETLEDVAERISDFTERAQTIASAVNNIGEAIGSVNSIGDVLDAGGQVIGQVDRLGNVLNGAGDIIGSFPNVNQVVTQFQQSPLVGQAVSTANEFIGIFNQAGQVLNSANEVIAEANNLGQVIDIQSGDVIGNLTDALGNVINLNGRRVSV